MKGNRKEIENYFNKRLRILIDVKKLSQADIAKKLNVSQSRISNWLAGKVETPRRATLQKLSEFFGCDIDWLADGTGEPFPTAPKSTTGSQPAIAQHQDKKPLSNKQLAEMAIEILESDSEFRAAFVANIESNYTAMIMETEMKRVEEDMEGMKERLERIEQLLLSIGATLPEKRDTGT